MSLFVAFAAQAATLPPPSPEVANEIVVIGQKVRTWKGRLSKNDGQLSCRTTRSTGDSEVDVIRCAAMMTCTRPIEAELERVSALKAVKRAERERQLNAALATTIPCMDDYFATASRALAERRVRG